VTLFVVWFLADINPIAVAAPAALLQTRYSRDFEREADAYAVELLSGAGIHAGHLADILERMSTRTAGGLLPDYLSTHPPTAERLQALRAVRQVGPDDGPRPQDR
jgi:predicted Zn-dependent protease